MPQALIFLEQEDYDRLDILKDTPEEMEQLPPEVQAPLGRYYRMLSHSSRGATVPPLGGLT